MLQKNYIMTVDATSIEILYCIRTETVHGKYKINSVHIYLSEKND
mgnify:CR=1